MLNVYLAIALLMHDLDGVKIKIRHPRQTVLVGLHAFTATIIFANIVVRSLYEADVSTGTDMRRWTLFAAIYLEATIGYGTLYFHDSGGVLHRLTRAF